MRVSRTFQIGMDFFEEGEGEGGEGEGGERDWETDSSLKLKGDCC